jgi:hypothetical protein
MAGREDKVQESISRRGPRAVGSPATKSISGEPMNLTAPAAPIATPLAIHHSEPSFTPSTVSTIPHSGRINDTISRR